MDYKKDENKKNNNNKIILISIILIVIICIGIYKLIIAKANNIVNEFNENVKSFDDKGTSNNDLKNPYNITNEYDGIYSFEEVGYNDANYKFVSKGIMCFENGSIYVKYLHYYKGVLSRNKYNYEEDTGVFGYENDSLKILFNDGDTYNILLKDGQLYMEKTDDSHFTGGCILKDNTLLQYKGEVNTISAVWEQFLDEMIDSELLFFENIRWNMSDEEVAEATGYTTLNSSKLENKNITYKTIGRAEEMNKYNFDNTVLIFNENQLKAYFMEFNYKNTYDSYVKVKELLEKNYGAPSTEIYTWKDEAYKQDLDKWNDAFKYSDFSIKTEWKDVEGFTLIVTWDYEKGSTVAYCEKGYEKNL